MESCPKAELQVTRFETPELQTRQSAGNDQAVESFFQNLFFSKTAQELHFSMELPELLFHFVFFFVVRILNGCS